jgi:phosphoribosylformylglycinamidine synthase
MKNSLFLFFAVKKQAKYLENGRGLFMDFRIFVEKKLMFNVEAESLKNDLNFNLGLDIKSLRLLNVYDLFNFSEELLEKSKFKVFGEVQTDDVYLSVDLANKKYLAVEFLPGQFDQRASSAESCVRLIDPSANITIKSSKLLIFNDEVTIEEINKIKNYYINKVESREKDLAVLEFNDKATPTKVNVVEGFIHGVKVNNIEGEDVVLSLMMLHYLGRLNLIK